MKPHIIALAVALVACGALPVPAGATSESGARAVDTTIWVGTRGQPTSWRPAAPNQVILWASPSRPYLVTIWQPVQNIRHASRLHVSRTGGRITRFDRVVIDGERLPIVRIESLDRDTARQWQFRQPQPVAF